jgi:hypothetical protein
MDQEMMWMRRALFRIAAAAPLSALAAATHAGPIRALSRMFNNTIQLKVTVIDEQRRPVPYATLCFLYGDALAPELSVNDMVRLVNRYRRDYDLVAVGSGSPFGAVLIRWANVNGTYSGEILENDYQRLAALPVIIGVFKRGFEPTAYAETIPVGASREIVLTMRKSADQSFDPRLLELDEIRSEVGNVFPNWTAQERMAHVDGMTARLLRLAQTFEREGKRTEAALAYYSLAYLPSIDRMVMPDGTERVIGYTRGYDPKSPTRSAHLVRALELGQDIPQLRCRALADAFTADGGRVWADQSKLSMRRRFVADLEACLKTADGRVFPWVLQLLWQTYAYIGEPEKACATLQHAYRFEPAAFEASAWPRLFANVESTARRPGPQSGLPAFPDFVCRMPART